METSKENPWKTLSSKVGYENQWIKVVENKVLTPTGKDGIYGVVHFKNRAMGIIPLDDEMNTWIVGQYRYTMNLYEWEIVEGGCPYGEDLLEGAKRELEEEVGLKAEKYQLILEGQLSNSVSDEIGYIYIARNLTHVGSSPEETEILNVRKLPFEELYNMALRGEIKDMLSLAGIFRVKLMLERGEI